MSIRLMSEVWQRSGHKGSALLLLLAIADHAHDDGTGAWPSVAHLARKVRMTDRNVQRLLWEVLGKGNDPELIIERGAGPGGAHRFTICVPDPGENISPPRTADVTPPVNGASPPGERGFTPPVNGASPKPSLNRPRTVLEPSPLEAARSPSSRPSVEELAQRIVVRAIGPWRAALGRILAATPAASFVGSFSNTRLEVDGDTARVIAPGEFTADRLRTRYAGMIQSTLEDVLGRAVVMSIAAESSAEAA